MTLIHFDYSDSYRQSSRGSLAFMPHRRHAANETTILPKPFAIHLHNGERVVDLQPSDVEWVWMITERINNTTNTWFATIPDQDGIIKHTELIHINPSSLPAPYDAVEPAWWAEHRQYQRLVGDTVTTAKDAIAEAESTLQKGIESAAQAHYESTVAKGYRDESQNRATESRTARDESRAARDTALAAAASATAPTDSMVAEKINDPSSLTATALSATIDKSTGEKINDPSSLTATALSAAIDKSTGWLATNHGMKGLSGVDDGAAFQALLNAASTAGAAVVLDSGKRFEINQRIYVPTGTKLLMDGATLVNKMTASLGDALLFIEGTVKEVLIDGGTIDGDRYNKPTMSEWQHGIIVQGSAKNVVIRRVHSKDNNGDGVYINGTSAACPENVTLDHVLCDNNVRQGLSITGVRGFNDFGSTFSNTNGMSPMAGVDLEPNTATSPMEGLKFHGTTITGNAGSGIDIAAWKLRTIRQGDVDFIGVTVTDNERGVRLVTGDGIRFFGGTINSNTSHGVLSSAYEGICTDVAFTGTEITGNGGSGIRVDAGIIGFSLVNCDVRNNTTAGAGVGVDLLPVAERPLENVTLIGNHMGGLDQTHALRTNVNVKKVTRVGNTYDPVQTALLSIADDTATRYVSERDSGYSAVRPLAGSTALAFHVAGEDFPRALIRADGDLRLGDGTAAGDTRLYRDAPDSLRTNDLFTADHGLKSGAYVRSAAYATANRPTADSVGQGARIFDTTLNQPIWSTGVEWVDAAGVKV